MCREITLEGHIYEPPEGQCTCCLIQTERAPADADALAHFGAWILSTYRDIEAERGEIAPRAYLEIA